MNPRNLIFSIFIISGLIYPSVSGAFVAAPAAGFELFSVGYEAEGFQTMQRNGAATPSILLQIDPTNGRVIEVGVTGFTNCKALDFTAEGDLLANCQRPDPPYEPVLVMLNPETGEGSEIGETGITENISDMSISTSGDKFAYEEPGGAHNLNQVDASTGAASFVGNPGIEGKGNALFFWGALNTLKLVAWGDDQNRVFELDQETAQPTFVTNLEMIDLAGAMVLEAPCVILAADSTRPLLMLDQIIETDQLDRDEVTTAGLTIIDGFRFEAVGLAEIAANGAALPSGIDNRLVGEPQYALSLIDLDQGISILAKAIEPGYILDGIALRPPPPRPIPTLSEWGLIIAAFGLLAFAIFTLIRRRNFVRV